ncbi:MAG: PHP domain-containing protein [Christensenellales bacterium]
MKANYHTHTARCGHATGTDEDYVLAAIEQGFDELGFSDHVPWPYRTDTRTPASACAWIKCRGI